MTHNVEWLDKRLSLIEGLLRGLSQQEKPQGTQNEYLHISEVIGRYCSRRSLYDYVNAGKFKLYKLGGKSYVKAEEFFAAFTLAVKDGRKKGGEVC